MSQPLLLDEMFSGDVAQQLRAKGYDVISVVPNSALTGLPDEQVLAYAATEGRALVIPPMSKTSSPWTVATALLASPMRA